MPNEAVGLYSQCSLEGSLIMTHNLTSEPRCAADLLLQRMNDVLRAAVGTNFSSNCSHAIDFLYESIDLHQRGMISRSEDKPLLYFARSFVIVFEEAMCQLQQSYFDIDSLYSMPEEAVALSFQWSLGDSLLMTHNLTSEPLCAADLLLQRMNDVLRAAVGSNFGSNCSDAIGALYKSIDREQPGIISCSEGMPLLYFARSFVIVFEEAMCRLQHTSTVPHSALFTTSDQDSKTGNTLMEEQSVKKKEIKDQRSDVLLEKQETKEKETEWKVATPAATATVTVAAAAPAALLATPQPQQQQQCKVPAVAPRPVQGNKRLQHPTRDHKIYDFSPEAIEGRIMIFNLPLCVSPEEIRSILRTFGRLLNFSYSHIKNCGSVFAKLESNEAANAAVKALHGTNLGGIFPLRVERAKYWSRFHNEGPQADFNANDRSSPRFGSSRLG